MKNYDVLCQAILKEIGSKDNVSFVTHCMTRLRMNLKDEGLVDMEAVKKIPEVLGCQFSGEQFQIIIGIGGLMVELFVLNQPLDPLVFLSQYLFGFILKGRIHPSHSIFFG